MAGLSGQLKEFHIRVGDVNATYFIPGDFQFIIRSGDGTSNPITATHNFTINTVPSNNYVDYIISLPTGISLIAGNTYTIEIKGLSGAVVVVGMYPPNYPVGGFYFNDGDNFLYNSYDMWFKTFIDSGASLNFDGFNDIVTINNSLGNFRTGDFTIEFDVKTIQQSTYIISKRGICDNDNFLSIGLGNGRVGVETANVNVVGSGTGFAGNIPINNNVWHRVSVTRIAGKITLYIDGVLDAEYIPTSYVTRNIDLNSTYVTQIGGNAPCTPFGPQVFNGNLDEMKFWDRGLTQCEIQNNMGAELAAGQSGLIAYYQFNQGVGNANNASITTLTDFTGNNNGTLSNFTLNGNTSNWITDGAVTSGTTNSIFVAPNTSITNSSNVLSVSENGATSYQWATCNGGNLYLPISGATAQSYTATNTGEYAVFVTKNGCTYRSSCFTVATLNTSSFNENNFNLYPNPTTGILNISHSKEISEMTILNILGQTVMTQKANDLQLELDLSPLSSGTYLIKIISEGQSNTMKIIKE